MSAIKERKREKITSFYKELGINIQDEGKELENTQADLKMSNTSDGNKPVEIIVFQDPRKKKKSNLPKIKKPDQSLENETQHEFDMKRSRHEVFKFGITGFSKEDEREAKTELAISLGAKPRKRKCTNYKALIEEKKELKKQNEELRLRNNKIFLKNKTGPKISKKFKRGPNEVSGINYLAGKYKHGIQFVDKKLIKK